MRGRELLKQQQLPEDPEYEARLIKMRDEMGTFRRLKLSPIERGWTGGRLPGRSIGPPDAIGEDEFEGFDTKCLEMKMVFNMKGNFGRKRRLSVLAVTGNGNGVAGFGLGKAVETRAAIRKAKNRAGQKLMFIKIYNNHTGNWSLSLRPWPYKTMQSKTYLYPNVELPHGFTEFVYKEVFYSTSLYG